MFFAVVLHFVLSSGMQCCLTNYLIMQLVVIAIIRGKNFSQKDLVMACHIPPLEKAKK